MCFLKVNNGFRALDGSASVNHRLGSFIYKDNCVALSLSALLVF